MQCLDKSPLKLSHQSQKKQTVETTVVAKSLNAYPFQVANGLAASSTDCRQIQNQENLRQPTSTTPRQTSALAFVRLPGQATHTQQRQQRVAPESGSGVQFDRHTMLTN